MSNQFILNILGGLGDVVGALPKALARRGHRVMVVLFFSLMSLMVVYSCASVFFWFPVFPSSYTYMVNL